MDLSERATKILRDKGWYVNGRIQRAEIAEAAVKVLDKHKAPNKAISIDGLCTQIFEYSDDSLRHLMARLVALRGPVQDRLNNDRNLVLCGLRMKEYVEVDGKAIERSAVGRFVTRDPDVIEEYLFDMRIKRHLSTADTTVYLMRIASQRVPAIRSRIMPVLKKLQAAEQTKHAEIRALSAETENGE